MNAAKLQILTTGRNTGFTRLTGAEIQPLMRKSKKTIRGLAAETQITMTRVREVRDKGAKGTEWSATGFSLSRGIRASHALLPLGSKLGATADPAFLLMPKTEITLDGVPASEMTQPMLAAYCAKYRNAYIGSLEPGGDGARLYSCLEDFVESGLSAQGCHEHGLSGQQLGLDTAENTPADLDETQSSVPVKNNPKINTPTEELSPEEKRAVAEVFDFVSCHDTAAGVSEILGLSPDELRERLKEIAQKLNLPTV